jgi:glycosyltransferase involved in cell wall biosynthesis
MRIALLAPLVSPIAPPYLGGAQALLADLAAGLAGRGHSVTLYAADGSAVSGVKTPQLGIDSSLLKPSRFSANTGTSGEDEAESDDWVQPDPDAFLGDYAFLRAYRAIAADSNRHDLVHSHAYDVPAFTYASIQPLPVMHTLHLPAQDDGIREVLAELAPPHSTSSTRLATVSHACAAGYAPFCRIDAVIYNGLRINQIPYGERPATNRYLLYAGRISSEKGVEDALRIAHGAATHLIVAGGIYDQEYYDDRIVPWLRSHPSTCTYLGALPHHELWELMAGAEAVLVPSHWEEPFGLVAAEAQAAGTPVVGYARGALGEVIADGETGWLVAPGDIQGAVEAVSRVGRLDRAACRARVEERFSLDAMLDAYLAWYSRVLED